MAIRVLVAEQDLLVRESLQDALRLRGGYDVAGTADARAAADALATPPPFDLALIDCSLSDGNGLALATRAANQDTPFLLMTTDYRMPSRFPAFAALFITKPFRVGDLLVRAQIALETARGLQAEFAALQAVARQERRRLMANLRMLQEEQ
jgi:DNA-binding response OmpR family regulator